MPHAFSRKPDSAVCRTCSNIQNHPFHYGHTPEENDDDDGPSGLSQALDIAIDVGIIASLFSTDDGSDSSVGSDAFDGDGGDFGGGGASSDW